MDWADAKQMLGSYSAWPKESPPKVFKEDVATDIPDSFDARVKWPGSIHDIRNQVTFRIFCNSIVGSIAFLLAHDWTKCIKYWICSFLKCQSCGRCRNYLKENKQYSLYLVQKSSCIFVLGHYLSLKAHSIPQAMLPENCSLPGMDNKCTGKLLTYSTYRSKQIKI